MSWARRWLMGAAGMLLLVQLLPAGRPAPYPLVGASMVAIWLLDSLFFSRRTAVAQAS